MTTDDQEMTLQDANPSKPRCTGHSHVKDADGAYAVDEEGQWIYKPCQRYPMKGQEVCAAHGGKAPQALKAAKARLLMASDPVTAELVAIALDRSLDPADRIRAQVAILDRAGIRPGMEVELETPPWMEGLKDLVFGKYEEPEPVKEVEAAQPDLPDWREVLAKAEARDWEPEPERVAPPPPPPPVAPLTGEVVNVRPRSPHDPREQGKRRR